MCAHARAVLIGLYEEGEKPSNPLEFIQQHLAASIEGASDIEALKKENEELKARVEEVRHPSRQAQRQRVLWVHGRVKRDESTRFSPNSPSKAFSPLPACVSILSCPSITFLSQKLTAENADLKKKAGGKGGADES